MTVCTRVCTSASDKQHSLEIFNEVWRRRAVTADVAQAWEEQSIATAEFLGTIDGVDAGSAAAGIAASRPHICLAFVTVLPHLRRQGVGATLFAVVSTWAAEQGAPELETAVEADDPESLAFALRRGFREHAREQGLELVLSELEPPTVEPPEGMEIVLLAERPDLAQGAYDVAVEALPDVPGGEDWTPPPFEQLLATHLHGLAIFLAVVDGEVAGYAKLQARPDARSATHGMTAVKRAWRGRGIAKALKRAEIEWAKRKGLGRLMATNEVRNTAMQHINASLGYRREPGRVVLRRSLGSSSLTTNA